MGFGLINSLEVVRVVGLSVGAVLGSHSVGELFPPALQVHLAQLLRHLVDVGREVERVALRGFGKLDGRVLGRKLG